MNNSAVLSPAPFGRMLTAMVTPFDKNGRVDYGLAADLANYLVDQGSDGIVVCGTTGESPTLTWQEQQKMLETVRDSLGSRAKVLVGTGSNSTLEAIEATKEASNSGADGVLVVVPYYNKPPQEGLEVHFRAIANAAPKLPLMLYNIPGRTGCSISPSIVSKLMDCSNVVSFKAASGTTEEVTQLRNYCGSDLAIYSGDDALVLPMLSVGAVGVVSVASHLVGPSMKKIIENCLEGKYAEALYLHETLQPLFKSLFASTNPIPIKAALQLAGWSVGPPRSPLVSLNSEMKEELLKILSSLRLL